MRLVKLSILLFFILLSKSCNVISTSSASEISLTGIKNSKQIQTYIDRGYKTIYLSNSKILIEESMVLTNGISIVGNKGVEFVFNSAKRFNCIVVNNVSNVLLQGFSITSFIDKGEEHHIGSYFPIKVTNSQKLNFSGINFEGLSNSCIGLYDVSNVKFQKCNFRNIGNSTKGKNYSYDGIFIGSNGRGTKDVRILECIFENIGKENGRSFANDGDGIQTYSKKGTIERIVIDSCKFRNISRRGIKVQSGREISIKNCDFEKNKIAVGVSMEQSTENLSIEDCSISNCRAMFQTNSYKNNPTKLNGFKFLRNRVNNIGTGLRTSGASRIVNAIFQDNTFEKAEFSFINGIISNSVIERNNFKNYHERSSEKIKQRFAILIWNGSESLSIQNNKFYSTNDNVGELYIYKSTKNIKTSGNSLSGGNKSSLRVRDRSLNN